jgi:hypothetical protein
MARGVTSIAAPGATLLMLAFRPGGAPRPLPRGADSHDLETAFPDWKIISSEAAVTDGMPGPLKKAAPIWYRLRRA